MLNFDAYRLADLQLIDGALQQGIDAGLSLAEIKALSAIELQDRLPATLSQATAQQPQYEKKTWPGTRPDGTPCPGILYRCMATGSPRLVCPVCHYSELVEGK